MAQIDFRVKCSFRDNPKRWRLQDRFGAEAVVALLDLWAWVREHRPDGRLDGMTDAEIERAAGWTGEKGVFVKAIKAPGTRFVDTLEDGGLGVHDWESANGYAVGSAARSAAARNAAILKSRARTVTPLPDAVWEWLTPRKKRKHWRIAPPAIRGDASSYADFCQRQCKTHVPNPADGCAPSPSPSPSPSPMDGGDEGSGSFPPSRPGGPVGQSPSREVVEHTPGFCARCADDGRVTKASAGPNVRDQHKPLELDVDLCAGHLTAWFAERQVAETVDAADQPTNGKPEPGDDDDQPF